VILAAALSLAQALSTPFAYPLSAVLDEARDTCAQMSGPMPMTVAIEANDWKPATLQPRGWLASYLAGNQKLGEVLKKPAYYELFRKFVAGRELTLYIFGVGFERGDARKWGSCEIMDLEAEGDISRDAVVLWAGREPVPSFPLGDDVAERWVPGLSPNSMDSAVTYSPPESPLADVRPELIYTLVAATEEETQ
jgi:hypothetical protein